MFIKITSITSGKSYLIMIILDTFVCAIHPSENSASPDDSGLRRSPVHSLIIVRHCVVRNWDRILVGAVKRLISWAGMVSICPLL